jgi:nicotinate phosphoribosyltransferase
MTTLSALYRPALGLLTDLYQLTMAQGYWKAGLHEREAVFHLTFRRAPFGGSHAIAAGLAVAADLIEGWCFSAEDAAYLGTLTGNDGEPLFEPAFLAWLAELRFTGDVHALPEGTVAFGHEPLLRVRAPLVQAQILETALLTIINFQTLIATKSARICRAAGGDPVLEFGLRRAQGIDGGLSASRAAYIGGCAATSNVLAGRLWGIPVKGTHAHAWVMVFEDEPTAFARYADAMPNNCVFLVDTYDTVEGVANAVVAAQALRARGHELVGVRLDSGALGRLAKEARRMLDAAGFPDAAIVASNDLDEHRITALKSEGAPIGVWGVGTRLVTAHDQPALGGVYKLAAIQDEHGAWQPRIKRSEQAIKVSDPGMLQVRRFRSPNAGLVGDVLWDETLGAPSAPPPGVPFDAVGEDLLTPVFERGVRVGAPHDLDAIRARVQEQLDHLPRASRRLEDSTPIPLLREPRLDALRARLLAQAGEVLA